MRSTLTYAAISLLLACILAGMLSFGTGSYTELKKEGEARMLKAPVVKPFDDKPMYTVVDSQPMKEVGIWRVIVKRENDPGAVTISSFAHTNYEKGQKVYLVDVKYQEVQDQGFTSTFFIKKP